MSLWFDKDLKKYFYCNKTIKIKYPKLLFLILIYIFTTAFFYQGKASLPFYSLLVSLKYIGIFFGGFFYAYGFTAAPATAILLVLAKEQSIFSATIIGGMGALLSDTIIFLCIRHSFINEIENLRQEKVIKFIRTIRRKLFGSFDRYLLPVIAFVLIASPLPTEIGVALLASLKKISMKKFITIAYLLHAFGIFVILLIGNM